MTLVLAFIRLWLCKHCPWQGWGVFKQTPLKSNSVMLTWLIMTYRSWLCVMLWFNNCQPAPLCCYSERCWGSREKGILLLLWLLLHRIWYCGRCHLVVPEKSRVAARLRPVGSAVLSVSLLLLGTQILWHWFSPLTGLPSWIDPAKLCSVPPSPEMRTWACSEA